jgi:hypothetical protein
MQSVKWTILILVVMFLFAKCAFDSSDRIIYSKASYSLKAVYELPNINAEIILERRHAHLFLAEYERTLVLRVGGKEVSRKEIAFDTGGYSRVNVYQISPTEYFLSGDLSFDKYQMDITQPKINEAVLEKKPSTAKFVGAFDSDERRNWRFITASEREEQKSKLYR